MDSTKQIIQSLRTYFDLCGLTQAEVAEKLGIAQPTFSLFLSITNPHRINNKSATRLCASFPFNFDYLVNGEGSLLIADNPGSDFPDRTNWSPYDYMVAIRHVEYEIKCHEIETHLSNVLTGLFFMNKVEGLQECKNNIQQILSLPEIQEPDWRICPAHPEKECSEKQLDEKLDNLLKVRSSFRIPRERETFFFQKNLPSYILNYFKRISE